MKPRRALMCRPTHFDVEYSINPWMDVARRVDRELASAQWQAVYDTLVKLGVEVGVAEPVAGLPDMTFAGDCGLAVGGRFLASNFRHVERRGETEPYVRWFERRGWEIVRLPGELAFEGLGDVVLDGEELVYGHGFRSSSGVLGRIRESFPSLRIRCSVELTDDRFYHAGLAVALLGGRRILYYPPAFAPEARRSLEREFPHALAVDDEDAMVHFACNNVVVGDQILMGGCSAALERQLERWGFGVIRCEVSEFMKSGASVRCLVLDVF